MIENTLVLIFVILSILVGIVMGYILNNIIASIRANRGECKIIDRSNVIGYDDTGYPLRLCIVKYDNGDYEQMWLDTNAETSDVEIRWENKDE